MRRITQLELSNPEFIRDLRNYTAFLGKALGLTPWCWRDWMIDLYRDLDPVIIDENGTEVFLDFECFEGTDEFDDEPDTIAYWFRDFCRRVPQHIKPRVRAEARPRIVTMGTLLSVYDPKEAQHWGRRITMAP